MIKWIIVIALVIVFVLLIAYLAKYLFDYITKHRGGKEVPRTFFKVKWTNKFNRSFN